MNTSTFFGYYALRERRVISSFFATRWNRRASSGGIFSSECAAILRIVSRLMTVSASVESKTLEALSSSTIWAALRRLIRPLEVTSGRGAKLRSADSSAFHDSIITPVGWYLSAVASSTFGALISEKNSRKSVVVGIVGCLLTGPYASPGSSRHSSFVASTTGNSLRSTAGSAGAAASALASSLLNSAEIPPGKLNFERSGSLERMPSLKMQTIATALIGQANEDAKLEINVIVSMLAPILFGQHITTEEAFL